LNDVTNLTLARYRFATFNLNVPGNATYKVEYTFIEAVTIEKDMDNYVLPYFQIDVRIPSVLYRDMKNNNANITADIDLQRAIFQKNEYTTNDSCASWNSYVSNRFYVLLQDQTPEINSSVIDKKNQQNGTYKGTVNFQEDVLVHLLLYRNDYYHNLQTAPNAILSNCTLIDAITYVLNTAGLTNILISPPTNYKFYREFCITPLKIPQQLNRICNSYALHNNGTIIFFDLDRGYILNKVAGCTAYVTNEFRTTYLISDSAMASTSEQATGCYSSAKDKSNICNIIPNTLQIKDLSGTTSQVYGNNFATINAANGAITTASGGANLSSSAVNSTTYYSIINSGEDTSSAMQKTINENGKVITMGLSAVDLEMLSPNKEYIVSLTDTTLAKYNGKYRMSNEKFVFQKQGEYFTLLATVVLKG
jgi:hypothetical protein